MANWGLKRTPGISDDDKEVELGEGNNHQERKKRKGSPIMTNDDGADKNTINENITIVLGLWGNNNTDLLLTFRYIVTINNMNV